MLTDKNLINKIMSDKSQIFSNLEHLYGLFLYMK